ncbi:MULTISPECIES: phage tail assembly protein [unclassified Snodgrassella]|uniref:phage tail assembly protein n=1 Tax=unclassified Snodgrassella TaxID=2625236 RepID=UPI0018DC4736|nr:MULTISPECIES: phage tail assembly protein [Snodgrassella]MBI0096812.1 phage tail assembly protein [Snodgrassella sp. W8134]MBI0101454.1 phage tail assembly protein [Snodgrassella sp. W8135]
MAQTEAQNLQEQLGTGKVIKLAEPLQTPSGAITELTLRRVRVKDFKRAAEQYPDNAVLQEAQCLAMASGLQNEDFDELSWEDYTLVRQFCLGTH